MLSKLRPGIRGWLEAAARPLVRLGFSPNHLTVLGLLLSLAAAYAFYRGDQRVAALLLAIGAFFDALDGSLARLTGRVTRFGGFLDSTLDRLSDAAILFGIALGGLVEWPIAFLALIGSYMVSYARCRAELAGSGTLAVGIAERGERLIIITIAALVGRVWLGVYLVVILAWITFFQRVWVARRLLRG
ncbi:archaetidylinositol phosphate synthase [Pyrococcus yayanosii]|uniref:Archaetidylinositol phosphate synthase n=1 Tax=Pyrococcus yayanosii (strain CH1 / JCM 16557) TaxID=529709 RepID=F8AIC3_PYRYC|nr:archaetidylinositol phosphate synthase [Pyrococcus yayanosii]AEH25526.1 CDP-diacylglycerol--glycerol-3-phosphate 3-phosphatidyltransferase [Pyrococcus yayanosii CH1]